MMMQPVYQLPVSNSPVLFGKCKHHQHFWNLPPITWAIGAPLEIILTPIGATIRAKDSFERILEKL